MATYTHETPYGGITGFTWDGIDGAGLLAWDSTTDSWDGFTITLWTKETKS